METARINSITRLRLNADGEGVRSVVFMHGCPLNCFWCCNPETRIGEEFKTLEPGELFQYIRRDVEYFRASGGGITFSGGEPLIWGSFLEQFISGYCAGFTVDVETSLDVEADTVRRLLPLINQWNVDFKMADPEQHREYTGRSNERILENLRLLAQQIPGERLLITYPVIPGYNDTGDNVARMIRILRELGISRIELHPYRKMAEEKQRNQGLSPVEVPSASPERLEQLRRQFRESGFALVERPAPVGKGKCEYLKALRRAVCSREKLPVEIAECTVNQPCIGTCPRCEYELDEINRYLYKGESGDV